ncbi:MAG: hypothetical protein RIA10_06370 [Amphiplicatus sp.]
MILRRVIAHFRKQEWTAIALDFLIVVVGVFVGLQVNNWNEARRDSALQEKLLERLEEEFRTLEPAVAELAAFAKTSYESTAGVIEALREETPPKDEAAFRFALGRANWVQNVPQAATSYTELVSTGLLSDIRSIELRTALIRYGDAHERVERLYPAATSVIFSPQSNYYRAVEWNMNPDTWTDGSAIVSYDWDVLKSSRSEMQGWISFQYDLALYAERELQEIRSIIAAIEDTAE